MIFICDNDTCDLLNISQMNQQQQHEAVLIKSHTRVCVLFTSTHSSLSVLVSHSYTHNAVDDELWHTGSLKNNSKELQEEVNWKFLKIASY